MKIIYSLMLFHIYESYFDMIVKNKKFFKSFFFNFFFYVSIFIDCESKEIESNRNINDLISWQSVRFGSQSKIGIKSIDLVWTSNHFEA
jgi:hypothetical protein